MRMSTLLSLSPAARPLSDYLEISYDFKKPPSREFEWRECKSRKFKSSGCYCRIAVSVRPDDCLGEVHGANGELLKLVEEYQPTKAYRQLLFNCVEDSYIPVRLETFLWKNLAPKRYKAGRRGHVWLMRRIRRFLRRAA